MEEQKENCMTCGTPRAELKEIAWGRYIYNKSYIQCKPCRQKEIDTQIECFQNSDPDTEFTDDIVCPYCGEEHDQDGESSAFYNDGEHDFDCSNCHNSFKVETMISFNYTTTKKA